MRLPHITIALALASGMMIFCASANRARASVVLGQSSAEAYASGDTVSDLTQDISGPGDYAQTASAPVTGGSWTGYWTWETSQWVWTWIWDVQDGQNTASYQVAVDTSNGLSISGSASAGYSSEGPSGVDYQPAIAANHGNSVSPSTVQAEGDDGNIASVTLTSAFSVTGDPVSAELSATFATTSSSISLTDTTTSQTLFSSTATFSPVIVSLPGGDDFLLQYTTDNTYPGNDSFDFGAVPEPGAAGILMICAALCIIRRRGNENGKGSSPFSGMERERS